MFIRYFTLLTLFSITIQACSIRQSTTSEHHNLEPICGGNWSSERERNFYPDINSRPHPVSMYTIHAIRIEEEEYSIDDFYCQKENDTIQFMRSFKNIQIPEMCIEAGIQGKTFYSVEIDDQGHFHSLKILRGVDHSFRPVEDQIKKHVERLIALAPEVYNSKILFSHNFRLK